MTKDCLHRYMFDGVSVRGELVQLDQTYQALTGSKPYPLAVQRLLGELTVATSLLTATLKFSGSITVQIQGDGPVSLVVINGNHDQVMRGTARWNEDALPSDGTLSDFMGKGHIVITIEPEKGERYQGIVGLEGETLEACLEDYFTRSEQLDTRLWLRAGEHNGKPVAAGMLLQKMPDNNGNAEQFDHLAQLTDTVKNEELFTLDAEEVLYRLYHQETVKLYDPSPVRFECSCSREKCASALLAVSKEDTDAMLSETGDITMHCDYCGTDYRFDAIDIDSLLNTDASSPNVLH